ncbi:hypothetical protein N0K08_09485 [Acidovorax sp. Be4]|uniref:Uncharacterized protein n=1 Tax=Acidovorax bellezanensis TaxID=2976702 RepID=A0ABT2PK58_9BURK|nr:hypothetical protein [Acidovorax sp. Be4]MCT9810867.1 hypothetical protein [Acidovorax sp. Be4]
MNAGNPMRLALSHYLRTLRERDEFDRLLPELLTQMGYVPLVKPKAGVRQFGVDFPAAGRSPVDGVDELLLFVIKQGDIGRRTWTGDPNTVRESIDEIIDVWLASHVPSEYKDHRKVIVLATTGDLGQEVQPNWAGFAARYPQLRFEFWGADKVSDLVEAHLLNEHLFDGQDRADLRKALVMSVDSDYRFEHLCRLMLRQLGVAPDGQLSEVGAQQTAPTLIKALRRVHLAALVCSHWADSEGERRQALWVMERTLLWCFHRVVLQSLQQRQDVDEVIREIWRSYLQAASRYYDAVVAHIHVKDGLSGYTREGAEYSVMLLEQVGLLASIGLSAALVESGQDDAWRARSNEFATALAAMIRNHEAAASPRLDAQVIDICLALVLFIQAGRHDLARWWSAEISGRLNLVFMLDRMFPVGTDSFDDLIELDVHGTDEFKGLMRRHSWLLATMASWCVMLGQDDAYQNLAENHAKEYPDLGSQLWHPTADWAATWYFGPAHQGSGSTEAPYALPTSARSLRDRIAQFNATGRLRWEENSPALAMGLWPLDFIACRHFRTPVPASMWYYLNSYVSRDEAESTGPAVPPL